MSKHSHYGLHCVQFHLGGFTAHCHTKVISYHFVGYLIHHLGNDRIHLSRHNGRAGLHGGQIDFSQSATRAGSQQTQVITYLIHLDSHKMCIRDSVLIMICFDVNRIFSVAVRTVTTSAETKEPMPV